LWIKTSQNTARLLIFNKKSIKLDVHSISSTVLQRFDNFASDVM